jgi:hypothetical protein
MRTIKFNVVKTQNTDEIISNEELTIIGGNMVEQAKICELQLRGDCLVVSLLVPKNVYDTIKDDKEIIVEENGWWTTLSDKNVVVKRTNGDVIKAMRMF